MIGQQAGRESACSGSGRRGQSGPLERQSGGQGVSNGGDSSWTGGSLQKAPQKKKNIIFINLVEIPSDRQTDRQVPSPSWLARGGGGGAGISEPSLGISGRLSSSERGGGGGGEGEGKLLSSSTAKTEV